MRLTFALVILFLFGSPVTSTWGQEYREAGRSSETVYYSGRITAAGVERFKSEASAGATILEITSGGGDETASLDMADEVRRRGMTVVVRNFCMSGCANAVFVAGKRRILLDGAVIGLHGSAIANRDSYIALHETVPTAINMSSSRYEELYKSQRISIRLLQCAAMNIGQTTKFIDVADPSTGKKTRGWISQKSLWAPSDAALKRFGLNFERKGGWPTTGEERAAFLSAAGVNLRAGAIWGEGKDCG